MNSDVISSIELQSLDVSTIGLGALTPINVAGVEGALGFIRITNDSNTDVYISFDGAEDNMFIPAGKSRGTYLQLVSSPGNHKSKMAKGNVIYARGIAGIGYVFVAGYYNE